MQCIDSADMRVGTRVFVRYDLDVPIRDGRVVETFRLDAGLKTLNYIIDKGVIPLIAGHLGRPGGKTLSELSTTQLKPYFDLNLHGSYELLENLRFDPREEANDPVLAKELAQKADIYVNESFANYHREHVSIVQIPKLLTSYDGFHLIKEVES
jgi:phosphoglycerate kinase